MLSLKRRITILLGLLSYSFISNADTTWVPIQVGAITTFVPYVPPNGLEAPSEPTVVSNGSTKTLTWNGVEHASKYEVQGLNQSGVWETIVVTSDTSIVMDGRFSGFSSVRVTACGYNSCQNTGAWSPTLSIMKKIIFIHTDLLGTPIAESDQHGNN
ncbi:hypothetical protein tloyanaT_21800 [Thalassotalea loyana]|uniref:Fibronectin type III domain-containing protein n=1 Tax=Thalassotalea loyana TaxID=280483 RepID=A0ABQ6HCW0_9GAMM|nr:hypothetical protein [Thalassotalea loyana]GLX85928.1 hypothetical protein tloyanaT_21800 [Thalassotalea loyana]